MVDLAADAPEQPRRWQTRPAGGADRSAWEELFEGYCDFYEAATDAAHRERVWEWIEAGTLHAILCLPAAGDGPPVGLAHLRPFIRPIRGNVGGYLDDLFVAPEARGSGAFEALMTAVRELAAAQGWELVRWITSNSNARARSAYERLATRTEWLTYELEP